ncbi:MAG: discoidin domain-containing protein [Thermoplasmata archaeon]|nr:discoidin domain-containing protein [Thermoplasmata archaeon]
MEVRTSNKLFVFFLVFILVSIPFFLVEPVVSDDGNENIGWELLDNNKVLYIWNQYNDYYFNTSNGVQFGNHYDEFWTHNVLMLGYYAGGNWNLIYRTDELTGFSKTLETDSQTYINATIWKDLTYGSYTFRLAIRYHLGVNDSDLTVIPYIKNLGIAIPYDIGFGWEMKDIKIANTYENDWIRLYNGTNWTSYRLNQIMDNKFTNMGNDTIFYLEGINEGKYFKRTLYLSWASTLNYLLWVKSRPGQYNAPVSLFINAGKLAVGQEKYTMMHWLDSDEWLGISSTQYNSSCGSTLSHTLAEALDGTDYWAHSVNENHWFILDLGDNYLIKKVKSRSVTSSDPEDVNVYVSMNVTDWGTAVASHVTTWQDTLTWVEVDSTDKIGRYIKIEAIKTEDGVNRYIQWGDVLSSPSSPFTIFDVFGDLATKTYYFNSYAVGECWATHPEYMVDGSYLTSASETIDGTVEFLDDNTFNVGIPGSFGEIFAVEIRACGFYRLGDNPADIILRPVFAKVDGDNHVYDCPAKTTPGSDTWSEWFDITSDTNAPTWDTWANVATLRCDVESVIPGHTILYCSRVEIRVTYYPPAETVILHPDAEGTRQQWLPYPSGTHWTKVDDVSTNPDEDATYVYTNVQNLNEEFNHETSGFTGTNITNVTLTARAKAVYSDDVEYTSSSDGYIYNNSASYALTRGATTGTVLVDMDTSRVGQQGTPIWQNQTAANSNQKLYSGSVVRAGQYVTSFPAVTVTRIEFMLNKSGLPTGTASVTIRSATGDTLLGTIGTINVATLTTTPTWYAFTTTPIVVTPAQNARFMIEYAGGNSANYVNMRFQSTNVIVFGARTTYNGVLYAAYSNDCTFRIKYYQYQVDRLYYFFDTSSLPDDATITAVTLNLYCQSDYSTTDFKITVQSGMPTYPHDPLVGGDFNMASYTGDGGTLTTVGISVLGWNVLTLNSTGRGWINKTSWTKFCLRSSRDIGNNNPTGNEYIYLATRSTMIPSNYPYLTITFTVPTPATLNLGVNVGGTRYGAPSNSTLSTSYADKTYTWAVNPATGIGWTESNITALQSSLLSSLVPCSNITIRCTQVYFTVEYSFIMSFDINRSSFDFGIVNTNSYEYSNQTSTQYTFEIYNNGTCAIDIDVNGTNATATGVSAWVLSAANGNNKYTMELYNLTTGWWILALTRDTWYSNMPPGNIRANLRMKTPTTFYSGKQMSCHIYLWASVH